MSQFDLLRVECKMQFEDDGNYLNNALVKKFAETIKMGFKMHRGFTPQKKLTRKYSLKICQIVL